MERSYFDQASLRFAQDFENCNVRLYVAFVCKTINNFVVILTANVAILIRRHSDGIYLPIKVDIIDHSR